MLGCLRILIGLILLVSGTLKLFSPYQNFQYVIQGYQMLPSNLEHFSAIVVPWIEFLVGLFMVLGLWVRFALIGTALTFLMFIIVVSQALLRGLNLDECGCFGEAIHIKPHVMVVIDSGVLLLTTYLFLRWPASSKFSVDRFFSK